MKEPRCIYNPKRDCDTCVYRFKCWTNTLGDNVAIQEAIDSCPEGGHVRLEPRVYEIYETIRLKGGISISGNGAVITSIGADPMFLLEGHNAQVGDMLFEANDTTCIYIKSGVLNYVIHNNRMV